LLGSKKRISRSRARDAAVGSGIAAVVIAAATFGELGSAHHGPQPAALANMQGAAVHHVLKAGPAAKAHHPPNKIHR
jgi:hypothetical protein